MTRTALRTTPATQRVDLTPARRARLLALCRAELADSGSGAGSDVEAGITAVLRRTGVPVTGALLRDLTAGLTGWGPVQELLDRPDVEEVYWQDPAAVFYCVDGATRLSNIVMTPDEAMAIVSRAVQSAGRRLDVAQPFVDADLPDGSRLHVMIPPLTSRHWAVNLRRQVLRPTGLADLVSRRALPQDAADVLVAAMAAGANVVVSGGTHTGKTTMLNALLGTVPGRRVITVEEVRELRLPHADWVALQARDAGVEGTGAVGLRELVRQSLRMRPDRIVVGEVRGAEALDLVLSMNCGIPAAGTVHANSAADAVDRLTGLPLLAAPNISADFLTRTVASCLDLVVHLDLLPDGRRVVSTIATVQPAGAGVALGQLFGRSRPHGELLRLGGELPAAWSERPPW